MTGSIGFLGTGRITTAITEGLCTREGSWNRIVLSPRNRDRSRALDLRFSRVSVAESNREVVDCCETVFIALRPEDTRKVLESLGFRDSHTVISLVSTYSLEWVRQRVAPAATVLRALPLPSVALGLGPIAIYPRGPEPEALRSLGTVVALERESWLDTIWSTTALIAPYHALVGTTIQWAENGGVPLKIAQNYITGMFEALSTMSREAPDGALSDLATEAATPGGLNEQALAALTKAGLYDSISSVLQAVFRRFPSPNED